MPSIDSHFINGRHFLYCAYNLPNDAVQRAA